MAAPSPTRREQRLARAAALRGQLRQRAAIIVGQADVVAAQRRAALDAVPPETTEGLHASEIQQAQSRGAYCTFRWYRFRCTCHRAVEGFGAWTRDRAAAEKERAEHLATVGGLPTEFLEV
jgi:hypothetical protein